MSDEGFPLNLVDAAYVYAHREDSRLCVLDASWHMPAKNRNGNEEWKQQRILNAAFFDYDGAIKDQQSSLPRMFPTAEVFNREVQKLGVNNDSLIVVYDNNAMFSSPRAWWMFRAMGHKNVAVLNGGLQAWTDAGLPLETKVAGVKQRGDFEGTIQDGYFVGVESVRASINNTSVQMLDARSAERFDGGHVPSAANRPYDSLLENGKMKSLKDLQAMMQGDIAADKKLLCTCGSGVTACVVALAATLCGQEDISVYDASWSQWGADESYPKESN